MEPSVEELARRISPQFIESESGEAYDRKLCVSDAAMTVVDELLSLVPPCRQRARALWGLTRAVGFAHTAIDLHPGAPAPFDLAEPPAEDDGPRTHPDPGPPASGMPDRAAEVSAAAYAPMVTRSMWQAGVLSRGARMQPLARLVALALAAAADETGAIPGRTQPTLLDLADATGLPTFHVHLILRDLDRAGWIARDIPPVGAGVTDRTRYRLTLPHPAPEPETEA